MLGIIGILAAAKRILGVFLQIKNNGLYADSSKGPAQGTPGVLTPNEWSHVVMSVSSNVTTFFVNGSIAGGSPGVPAPIVFPSAAKLQNVNYLRNTSLNINANSYLGANNKTFIDKSPVNSTILTTSGALVASGVTLGSFSPYSNQEWSAQFSTTDYLSVNCTADQFAFEDNDVTMEFWAYGTTSGVEQYLLDFRTEDTATANLLGIYISAANKLTLYFKGNQITDTNNFLFNQWNHIAFVNKQKYGCYLFVNGNKIGEYDNISMLPATRLVIGRNTANIKPFNGYISNLRIVKGTALYSNNFIPTSQALKLIPAKEIKTQSIILPEGNNAFLSADNIDMSIMALDDFAVEMWIYKTTTGSQQLIDNRPGSVSNNSFYYYIDTAEKVVMHTGNTSVNPMVAIVSNTIIEQNTWYHLRFTRDNEGYKLYINGVLEGSQEFANKTYFSSSQNFLLGRTFGNTGYFKGYISNLRIIKGSTINYLTINPPSSTLQLVGVSATNYTGVFNGTNSYLSGAANISPGTNDFTVECFAYINNPAATGTLSSTVVDMRAPGASLNQIQLLLDPVGMPAGASKLVYVMLSTRLIVSTIPVMSGNWYHFALVRNSGTSRLYIDGKLAGSTSNASALNHTTFHLGVDRARTGGFFNGLISNFRFVNNSAVYTSEFDRPTTDLTPIAGTSLLTLQNSTLKDNSTSNYIIDAKGAFSIAPQNLFEDITNNFSIRSTSVGGITGTGLVPPITLRNSEFTLEFYLYIKNIPTAQINFFGTDFYLTTGMVLTLQGRTGLKTTLKTKKWYHIALVKTNGKATIFVDGKLVGEGFNFPFVNAAIPDITNISIGAGLDGYIAEYRLVAGALYYTNFTPSTSSLPVLGDNALNGYSAYFNGGSLISNTSITNNALNIGEGNVTIEFFIHCSNYPVAAASLFNIPIPTYANFLQMATNGVIQYWVGSAIRTSSSIAVPLNKWTHVALVKNANNVSLFFDGVQTGTAYTTCPSWGNVASITLINGTNLRNTYIRDLRISQAALYTSNFTSPTSSLGVSTNTRLLILKDPPASNTVDSPLEDKAGFFTDTNSLTIKNNPLLSSANNPFDTSYTPNKTCLLISAKNRSIADYSFFNYPISGISNTYYHSNNPWIIKPIRTTLLTLTSNSIADTSGHISLSSVSTSFSAVDPFGSNGYSVIFNGTGYLSAKIAGKFIDEDDFTLDAWFYQTSAAAGTILDTAPFGATSNGYRIGINAANRITIQSHDYTTTSITGPTIETFKWNHFAISRIAGVKSEYFLNGKYIGSDRRVTDGTSTGAFANDDINAVFNPSNFVIGALNTGGTKFVGLMSNFRVIKGLSQYNFLGEQVFPVPTNEVQALPEITPTTYSQYLPGGSSFIKTGKSNEFAYGLSSFTIEMWINPQEDTNMGILDHRGTAATVSTPKFHLFRGVDGKIYLNLRNNTSATVFTSSIPTPLNRWSHIALSRLAGSGMTLYINGLSAAYYDDRNISWANDGVYIGGSEIDSGNRYKGLISNVRITKNIALYTGSSFTVPTSPLTPILSYPLSGYSTIFNSSKKSLITIDTTNYPNFNFGTDSFCVEFFVYPFNDGKVVTFYDSRPPDNQSGNFLRIERRADNKITCYVAGLSTITSTVNVTNGNWYHIAYQRTAGSNSTLYINGVSNGTINDSLSTYAKVNYIYMGGVTAADAFDGCISNLRISNSVVYNAPFIPPTSNLSATPNTQLLLFRDNNLIDGSSNTINKIYNFPSDSYLTTNGLNPFYPKDTARTILLTLQDEVIKDNSFVFVESNSLTQLGAETHSNNPFNNPVTNEVLALRTKDDFKTYRLFAYNNATVSYKNPLGPTLLTSFLSINSERYKDSSIYNAPLYNTTSTQQARFSNLSPFLNLTPYTSANGGSIYFGDTNTKFLVVSSKGLVTKFGTDAFTIEFWLYKNTTAASQMMIFDTMSGTAPLSPGHMQIYLDATNKVVFYAGGAPIITSTFAIPSFSWQHIAIARKAAITTLYINGVANNITHGELNVGAVSTNYTDPEYFSIGSRLSSLNTNTLTGYITDFHIVSGSCLYKSNFSPPIEPLSSFANTKLLINADNAGVVDTTGKFNLFTGGNGVSISNDVPNISASASTGTLSAGSIYFDGSGNSFVFTDSNSQYFNLSGNFTAELWFKLTVTPTTSAVLFSIRNTDTDKLVLAIDNNRRVVYRSTNSTTISSITAITPVLDNWNHVVITRALSAGTTYKTTLYVNGTDSGFISAGIANTNKLLHIGSDNNNNRFTGYIDDFKIVKEVMGRYSSNVNVPLRESEIQNNLKYPDLDYLDETKLIINADTTTSIDNNAIIDESSNSLSISKQGTIYQGSHTILSPGFGYNPTKYGGSIYLDGNSYLYINDTSKQQQKPFNLEKNYTIEAWVKPLNSGANPPIFDSRKKAISATIGTNYKADSKFKGYITGIKTSKGISRYNNNFTVDMTPATTDSYTSLLLNFGKAGIVDSLSKNNIATVGSAVLSFEKKKFDAGGSVYFDGNGYLAIPENNHFLVNNADFTIEWHMYLTSNFENYGIFTTASPDTSAADHLYITFKNNALCLGTYGGYEATFPTCTGVLDQWMHVAVVRENGNCRVYRNGISQGTVPFSVNVSVQNGAFIGQTYNAPMHGYIDEFRFTNGVCRHTANFDPDASFSALIDATGTQYTQDTSTIILDPPRYPSSNVMDDYLAANGNIKVDYLIVGGGGAGGSVGWYFSSTNVTTDYLSGAGGGGGGGEVKSGTFVCDSNIINVTIGAGGTSSKTAAATNGSNSTIKSNTIGLTAIGGGAGATFLSKTNYFLATSGGNGGGSFHFDPSIPLNVGGYGVMMNGETSTLSSVGGSGGGASSTGINNNIYPASIFRVTDLNINTIGINNGGAGFTWPLADKIISLSGFSGGGQGGVRVRADSGNFLAGTVYALIYNNKWGGGGLLGVCNTSTMANGWATYGSPGIANTGGGGGGGYVATRDIYTRDSGNGGSGCAIFKVPLILNNFFLTTGTVDRIQSGDNMFIIFKSSGTLQLI